MTQVNFLLVTLALHITLMRGQHTAYISNIQPRLDTNQRIVCGGDGNVIRVGDMFYYYAVDYGLCTEQVQHGSLCVHPLKGNTTCGFRYDHQVVAYSSKSLESGSWALEGSVLPMTEHPPGVLFRVKVVYNPNTSKFVLWIRVVPLNQQGTALDWLSERFIAATSYSATGPFELANARIPIRYSPGADFSLFVDHNTTAAATTNNKPQATNDNTAVAYVVYTSHATNVRIVVERLTPDFLSSTNETSTPFAPTPVEAPAMFKRKGFYYVTFGHTCCYCLQGSGVRVYASSSPLSGYQYLGDIVNETAPVTHAQQNYVFQTAPENASSTYLWTGTRWGSAPDHLMANDFQTWLPLQFDDSVSPPRIKNITWLDAFSIEY
eukprot:m.39107 g.39107  ORF g.39107 m.39107 type:complete len:378 (+) comp16591_c0_seq1:49-1182(+)